MGQKLSNPMKRSALVVIAGCVLCGAIGLALRVLAQPPSDPGSSSSPGTGRFAIAGGTFTVMLDTVVHTIVRIDTLTGRAWWLGSGTNGIEWVSIREPAPSYATNLNSLIK